MFIADEQKWPVITQTANKIGLPVQAIEKDFWVTTILQIVFTLPMADKLVFKGGTSLSKVWNLIKCNVEELASKLQQVIVHPLEYVIDKMTGE